MSINTSTTTTRGIISRSTGSIQVTEEARLEHFFALLEEPRASINSGLLQLCTCCGVLETHGSIWQDQGPHNRLLVFATPEPTSTLPVPTQAGLGQGCPTNRAAYEENGGCPDSNPFGASAVRIYMREVREGQANARGIPDERKKRRLPAAVGYHR